MALVHCAPPCCSAWMSSYIWIAAILLEKIYKHENIKVKTTDNSTYTEELELLVLQIYFF